MRCDTLAVNVPIRQDLFRLMALDLPNGASIVDQDPDADVRSFRYQASIPNEGANAERLIDEIKRLEIATVPLRKHDPIR